ncbi:serine/threonine-protein kinase [Magnetococcus marinus]|nr:serine/threonine-protein kinase [Magnetococcus marinus]
MLQPPLPPGFKLTRYTLDKVMATGTYAIAYLAQRTSHAVVIKEFFPKAQIYRDEAGNVTPNRGDVGYFKHNRSRFRHEAELLARLHHPGIIPLEESFDALGTSYLVMPYVAGENLHQRIRRRPLHEGELHALLVALAQGLIAVHEAGYCHLDIKPNNVLLQQDGSPVLIDFGAAWHQKELERGRADPLFTRDYSPYELFTKQHVGCHSDLYSLGALAYRLLTGHAPVCSQIRHYHLHKLGSDPQRPLHKDFAHRYSRALLDAIDTALILESTQRPGDLHHWLTHHLQPRYRGSDHPHPMLLEGDRQLYAERPDEALQAYQSAAQAGDYAAHRAIANLLKADKAHPSTIHAALLAGSMAGDAGCAVLLGALLRDHPKLAQPPEHTPIAFYQQAAKLGNRKGMYRYAHLLLKQARAKAGQPQALIKGIHWLRRAAQMGYAEAQWRLFQELQDKQLPSLPPEHPFDWLQMVAFQEWPKAALRLAGWYEAGDAPLPEVDLSQAYYWYRQAALHGALQGQLMLAQGFLQGRGVARDPKQAFYWFEVAAQQQSEQAYYHMALQLHKGHGVIRDRNRARTLFQQAAQGGYGPAQKRLGDMLARGEGGPRQVGEAIKWYMQAAAQQVEGAQQALQRLLILRLPQPPAG